MDVVSEGNCMFGEARCHGRLWPLDRPILAVLTARMGLDQMLADCGSVQKASRNHESN